MAGNVLCKHIVICYYFTLKFFWCVLISHLSNLILRNLKSPTHSIKKYSQAKRYGKIKPAKKEHRSKLYHFMCVSSYNLNICVWIILSPRTGTKLSLFKLCWSYDIFFFSVSVFWISNCMQCKSLCWSNCILWEIYLCVNIRS